MAISGKHRNFPFRTMKNGQSVTFTQGDFGSEYDAIKALSNAEVYYKKTYGIDIRIEKTGEFFTVTVINNPKPLSLPGMKPTNTKSSNTKAPSLSRIERSYRSFYREAFVALLDKGVSSALVHDEAMRAAETFKAQLELWAEQDAKNKEH